MSGAAVTSGNIEMASDNLSAQNSPHSTLPDKAPQLNNAPSPGATSNPAHPGMSAFSSLSAMASFTQARYNLPQKPGGPYSILPNPWLSTQFQRETLVRPAGETLPSFRSQGVYEKNKHLSIHLSSDTCHHLPSPKLSIQHPSIMMGWKWGD